MWVGMEEYSEREVSEGDGELIGGSTHASAPLLSWPAVLPVISSSHTTR